MTLYMIFVKSLILGHSRKKLGNGFEKEYSIDPIMIIIFINRTSNAS